MSQCQTWLYHTVAVTPVRAPCGSHCRRRSRHRDTHCACSPCAQKEKRKQKTLSITFVSLQSVALHPPHSLQPSKNHQIPIPASRTHNLSSARLPHPDYPASPHPIPVLNSLAIDLSLHADATIRLRRPIRPLLSPPRGAGRRPRRRWGAAVVPPPSTRVGFGDSCASLSSARVAGLCKKCADVGRCVEHWNLELYKTGGMGGG